MSNTSGPTPQRDSREGPPPAGLAALAGEIRGLLSALTDEIQASQRHHDEALAHIKSRIAAIEGLAEPPASRTGAASAAGARTADTWDPATAELLTQVCEAQDAVFNQETPRQTGLRQRTESPPARPAALSARNEFDYGHMRLAPRLADISQRIMRSLNEMRPQSTRAAIEARLEQLQARIGSAVADVARRSDVKGLSLLEAHVRELRQKLEQAQTQLARLDGIDAELKALMGQVSDERLSALLERDRRLAGDYEAIARSAAEAVQTRYADLGSAVSAQGAKIDALRELIDAHIDEQRQNERQMASAVVELGETATAEFRRFDELKELLETSIGERRRGEEQAMALLDTLHEALARVLDRIEGLDAGARSPSAMYGRAPGGPRPHGHVPTSGPLSRPATDAPAVASSAPSVPEALGGDDRDRPDHDDEGLADGWEGWGASAGPATTNEEPAPPSHRETSEPAHTPAEKLRQELVLDAQRARLKADSRGPAPIQHAMAWPPRGTEPPGTAAPGPRPHAGTKGRTIFGISPRLLTGALATIVGINAGLLLISGKPLALTALLRLADTPVAPAPRMPVPSWYDPAGLDDWGGISGAAQESGTRQSDASEPETWTQGDPVDAQTRDGGSSSAADGDTAAAGGPEQDAFGGEPAALPGLTVQRSPVPAGGEELARSYEDHIMAALSAELGDAAARSSETALVENGGSAAGDAPAASVAEPDVTGRTSQLDLPPASVGPLSLRLAAANGDPSAEFEVASRLAEGKGTEADLKEAIRWYQRSAAQGFAQAQYRLGTLFERGLGTEVDVKRASVWYRRAAEQGNVKAMHNLAVLSAGRDGGSPDYATAAKWFTQAAERGLVDSQYNLAVLYENGLGVKKNAVMAYKWYSLAASGGDNDAMERRDQIKARLTTAELETAQEQIASFVAAPVETIANDPRAAGEDWKKRQSSEVSG